MLRERRASERDPSPLFCMAVLGWDDPDTSIFSCLHWLLGKPQENKVSQAPGVKKVKLITQVSDDCSKLLSSVNQSTPLTGKQRKLNQKPQEKLVQQRQTFSPSPFPMCLDIERIRADDCKKRPPQNARVGEEMMGLKQWSSFSVGCVVPSGPVPGQNGCT